MKAPLPPGLAADVATVQRIDSIPAILKLVSEVTGLGFAAVARVTGDSWTCCAVQDGVGFGMVPGDQLEVGTTLCNEVQAHGDTIVIRHAGTETAFCNHPTPKMYGFESYISAPIVRRNGQFFGTLCALDPKPSDIGVQAITTVELLAGFVAAQFEIEERLADSHRALDNATEIGGLREQFIAVLGHDLRNPLSSMLAGVDLLAKQSLDAKGGFILDQMRQSGRRMVGLIDDILDFARGRMGGGIPVQLAPVDDLGAALARVVAETRAAHPQRQIDVAIALDGPVTCDPARLNQLFSNLLGNAVTHGAADRPIEVRALTQDGEFELSVTNWGEPIPAADVPRLFLPYTRRDRGKPEGLGLGLYIAAEIARAHGGTLTVISSATDGTTFAFRCPTCAAQAV